MTALHLFQPDQPPPRRRLRRKLPVFLRDSEIAQLFSWCDQALARTRCASKQAALKRDRLVLHLGVYLGLRSDEMIHLRIEHIDLDQKSLFVCEGKGCRDRYLPIPDAVVPLLRLWIGQCSSGLLMVVKGKCLPARTLRNRMDQAGKRAGLTKHLHPHVLRHTYATRLLQKGADIRTVQELMGHSDISTTGIYLHVEPSRLREAVERL